jgi:hypothetical protein
MTGRFVLPHILTLAAGLLLLGIPSGPLSASSGETEAQATARGAPDVTPQADRILREMGEYLASAQEFTFRADISFDGLTTDGQKILYGASASVSVHRPDRLRVERTGDERSGGFVLDGGRFAVYDATAHVYALAEVPPEIDAAVDRVFEVYGFSPPIADLVYADPYRTLIENVAAGSVIGRHRVAGTACLHLAFSQEAIDWQIWIEDGPRPVPRQLVITYKNEPGSPQYIARLSGWDFQPRVSDHYFEFQAPAAFDQIEFLSLPQGEVKP